MFSRCLTVALNHEQIKTHPERISKIKPYIDQHNWKEINFPSHKKNWKSFKLNDKPIALNISYVPYNTKKIRHAYKSKYNLERENKKFLLMIIDDERWYYLACKKVSCIS